MKLAVVTLLTAAAVGATLTLPVGRAETPAPAVPAAAASSSRDTLRALEQAEADVRDLRRELEAQRVLVDELLRERAPTRAPSASPPAWPQPDVLRGPYAITTPTWRDDAPEAP